MTTAPLLANDSEFKISDSTMNVQRVPGSYRDPSGFVFEHQNEIFRSIDEDCYQTLLQLAADGKLEELVERQLIVGTEFVESGELFDQLRAELPETEYFLLHQRVPFLSYPYEWTVSMLADAGIHTLDLQIELLENGCSLKDATAYNVQFMHGRPTMIDIASIERPSRLDLWVGLGQFLQMFVYPLLLNRYRGWDLRSYFLAHLNGMDIGAVARAFGTWGRLRPNVLLDVSLPYWLQARSERKDSSDASVWEKRVDNTAPQVTNLKRLRRKLQNLSDGYQPSGVWSEYTRICNYDPLADQAKQDLVRIWLQSARPSRVLDIGCNTGTYSFLAADCGAQVTAVDGDHDAVEVLYRRLRDQPAAINPLVMDLANPSPAIGHMNVERDSFLQRNKSDCVLALALMHHLVVSANLSLDAIATQLAGLTQRDVILEFVPTDDSMFQRLTRHRRDSYEHVTLANTLTALQQHFQVMDQQPIDGSKRTLLLLRKR